MDKQGFIHLIKYEDRYWDRINLKSIIYLILKASGNCQISVQLLVGCGVVFNLYHLTKVVFHCSFLILPP